MDEQKKLFRDILIFAAIILSILPVIVTFSSVLTKLFDSMGWYVWLQNIIVPIESRLVAVIVKTVGITARISSNQDFSLALIKSGGGIIPIKLEWNCLGWQSMILLAITFLTGLKKYFTNLSKLETIIIGILGTFLVNLIRMAFVVAISYYWNSFAAMIIHDYLASLVAIVWIMFFWWFSYSYILEER